MKRSTDPEVATLLDDAISVDPKNVDAYMTYAKYLADRGDWKKASAKAQSAIDLGKELPADEIDSFKMHGFALRSK
jgi:hypothetical protein